jgi:SpoIVB peptidase S55
MRAVTARVAAIFVVILSCCFALPQTKATAGPPTGKVLTMPVSDIKAGMKGVAYTVFEGTQPEPMDLTVLGVLKNANGPKGDIILIRLEGTKPDYTGVVAGMSGSPVYIDGKLVGALAFRIGQFSKEPIAGVTPIADMLEINAMDKSVAPVEVKTTAPATEAVATKTSGPGEAADVTKVTNMLTPIETPLVFDGFSEDAVKLFAPQFAKAGIVPVMGAGSVTNEKQPEPLVPGSAVSAILVRGDLNIAATCTVTYMDPQRLLACGHPLLQYGQVELPMTKANVIATLPSPLNAFKIVNTTEEVGTFVQDRHTGILGRFGAEPQMIPVTLSIHGGETSKTFHYEVLNNAKLTPVAIMATAYSALQGLNEYGEDVTYRFNGQIKVGGFPLVNMQDMYTPMDGGMPTAYSAALGLGEKFGRIYDNPYAKPTIDGVNLDFDLVHERRWARLDTVRTDVTEARPGDEILVEASLRPYRGDRIVKQIPIKIPTSTPKGTLRILVSDGDTLDRMRTASPYARKLDLGSTIAQLNQEHVNSRLYVSLMEENPEARVGDKIMPTLPLSVINVMDGAPGSQDMVVTGESSVNEASMPLDYVVSGAQMLTVTIK